MYRTELKRFPTVDLPLDAAKEPSRAARQFHSFATEESAETVRRAVLALPPRYREPVILFYFQEMDLGLAAATMGMPEGTMKARLARARALLRRRFPHLKALHGEAEHAQPDFATLDTGMDLDSAANMEAGIGTGRRGAQ